MTGQTPQNFEGPPPPTGDKVTTTGWLVGAAGVGGALVSKLFEGDEVTRIGNASALVAVIGGVLVAIGTIRSGPPAQ